MLLSRLFTLLSWVLLVAQDLMELNWGVEFGKEGKREKR